MSTDSLLDAQFPAHLQVLCARTDAALEATGFDALAIHSGRATHRFLDDREVPFVSNPHFRHWAPVLAATDSWVWYAPGAKPRLLFHRPADYWHAAPPLPASAWTDSFELEVIESPGAARALLPAAGKRVAYLGEFAQEHADWGFAAANPSPLLSRLHYARAVKTGYELDCMRAASRRGVRAHRAAETAWRAGRSEFDTHLAYCAAADLSEVETALRQHHRLRQARGGAALPAPGPRAAGAPAQLPDRRGCAGTQLRLRHYAYLRGRGRDRIRRTGRCARARAARALRRRCGLASTTATSTSPRTAASPACCARPG